MRALRSASAQRPLTLVGVTMSACLALTACGSGDAPDGDDGSSSAPVWTETDPDLAAELEAAGNDGTLVVATDLTIGLPWAVEEDGEQTGLDIDLATALGEVLGAEIDLQNTSFDSLIPGLVANRYDVSISAMLDNKKRQEQVDFVDFIIDASGFIVPVDSDLADLTLETSCGRTIGVVRGSAEEMYLTEQSGKCEAQGEPAVDLQVFQQLQQGVLAVTSGRIEALCGDKLQNAYLESQPGAQVKQAGGAINEAPVGMALPKGSELVPVFQKALQELIDSGVYLEILKKYGVEGGALETATVNDARN
ncbi:ABC transporter substrate-binding protein [Blastococcus sp. CT_GayMR20]|uniref:ABC transporter substrate-binding protein n=1 Tax=Blastococcus sp. CT_GayMR20 TaxID=2559609 RepID=UPI0010748F8F|nr:ABC transporter substrate-binding protein [Blastococcus sp. CT_GayMR20]TFV91861.1 ABC transporter substrate-binding protein [Blastococcus sp. CT_GayMR20]TFV91902.1 ABC transporter substrate-binding protein [Blastococcus sp. CT_GayMR20]